MSAAQIVASLGYGDSPTLVDMLRSMAHVPSGRTAIEYLDDRYSYGDLLKMVAGAAAFLEESGVRSGDHVATMFRGDPDALVSQLAVALLGAVLIPVPWELEGDVLCGMLARFDVSVIVLDSREIAVVEKALGSESDVRMITSGSGTAFSSTLRAGADITSYFDRSQPSPDSPGLILATSGTTGDAKGVVLSRTWAAKVGPLVAGKHGTGDQPKSYFCISWGHGTNLVLIGLTFWHGGTAVITPKFSASNLWKDLRQHQCTHVLLLAAMFRMVYNQPEQDSDRGNGTVSVVSVGMPKDLWADFAQRFDVTILEQYSATDAGGELNWLTNSGNLPPGYLRPWDEVEVRLVDDQGKEVAEGDVGELNMRTRGRAPVVEYYKDPDAGKEKTTDGWVWLGDYFRRGENGCYEFIGRKRDIIRRRAMNIAPADVEQTLARHPDVAEVAVFAVPADLDEDEIKAVVIASRPGLSAKDIVDIAATDLPRFMRPRFVEIVDALPLTASGRVQRYRLEHDWRTATTWDAEAESYLTS